MEALNPTIAKMMRAFTGGRAPAAFLLAPEEFDDLRAISRETHLKIEPIQILDLWVESSVPTRELLNGGVALPFMRFRGVAVFVDRAVQPGGGMSCALLK